MRGQPLDGLKVDIQGEKLPESTFRFLIPRAVRKED
jgi:hypothetical protein